MGRTRGTSTRTAGTIAGASAFGPRNPSARTQRAGLCCPSGPASRIRAKIPRGRITGLNNAAGSDAVAKIQPVGDDPPHAQMPRQWPHHVIQPLAHQNHVGSGCLQSPQLPNSFFFEQRLELVFKFFFAQQVQPVARDAAQHRMHNPGSRYPIRA